MAKTVVPLLAERDVQSLLGVSKSALRVLERAGEVPAPVACHGTVRYWLHASFSEFAFPAPAEVRP